MQFLVYGVVDNSSVTIDANFGQVFIGYFLPWLNIGGDLVKKPRHPTNCTQG